MTFLNIIFKHVKYRYLEFKWDRVLKKSGCRTWGEYFRYMDIDYNPEGAHVGECLHGYPYLIEISDSDLGERDDKFGTYTGLESIARWCNQNCVDKYRIHVFLVKKPQTPPMGSWHTHIRLYKIISVSKLHIIGMYQNISDTVIEKTIVAFKSQDDAALFSLGWG